MFNKLKMLMMSIALFVVALLGVACGGVGSDSSSDSSQPAPEEIRLTYNVYELDLYESFQLTCINYKDVDFLSKDESIVVVDAQGKVTAVGEGATDVLVTKDEKEATCRVSVTNNGLVPVVTVNVDDEINMYKNESLTLTAQALFKGKALETSFSFQSSNESVATVSQEGVVTSVGYGVTTLTVSTTFAGKEWTKMVRLQVLSNSEILLTQYDYSIDTNDIFGGATSFTLYPTIVVDGETLTLAEFSYRFDETLLERNGNTFSLLEGIHEDCTTVVEVIYEAENEEVKTEANVTIQVPTRNRTSELTVYADNWKDAERSIQLGVQDYTFLYTFEGGLEVTKVVEVGGIDVVDMQYEAGSLKIAQLSKGVKTWRVYNAIYSEIVTVQVVDKVITTAEQFRILTAQATNEHMVLGCDLENVGLCVNSGKTFSGVFDGNYHTVSGVIIDDREADEIIDVKNAEDVIAERISSVGGLFYKLEGATIKNVSFKQAQIGECKCLPEIEEGANVKLRSGRAFFAFQGSNSEIFNVNLELENVSGHSEGAFVFYTGEGLKLNSIVMIAKMDGENSVGFPSIAFGLNKGLEVRNVFLLSNEYPFSLYNAGYEKSEVYECSNMQELKFSVLKSDCSQYIKDLYKSGDQYVEDDFV